VIFYFSTSSHTILKFSLLRTAKWQSVLHLIVATQGLFDINASSPNYIPSDNVSTSFKYIILIST